MPRTKPKYAPEPEPRQASVTFVGLPFSMDLRVAAAYTDFSVTDIEDAVRRGELAVVSTKPSDKPYRVIRTDLEKWVTSKRHLSHFSQSRTAEKR